MFAVLMLIALIAAFVPGVALAEEGAMLDAAPADEWQSDYIRGQPRVRPEVARLPVPLGATRAQVAEGDRIFHGEAAGGRCSLCHGIDAKGTGNGNDLTVGLWIWSDGSLRGLKRTVLHNMAVVPGMDGRLAPPDVDAVVAYVWAIGHQGRSAPTVAPDEAAGGRQ